MAFLLLMGGSSLCSALLDGDGKGLLPVDQHWAAGQINNTIRVRRAPVGGLAITSAAIAGASLVGTSASQLARGLSLAGWGVATVIEIENRTKRRFTNPFVWLKWGKVEDIPVTIRSGEAEAVKTHKTAHTAVGSAGKLAYHIEGLDEVLYIVWHAPYNFNHLSNYLAIGMYNGKDATDKNIYYQMRNGPEGATSKVGQPTWPGCQQEYYSSINPCTTYSPNLKVTGTMGTSHHPVMHIEVTER